LELRHFKNLRFPKVLYGSLEIAGSINSARYFGMVARFLCRIFESLLKRYVGDYYQWEFEDIELRYKTTHPTLKWWFSCRHRLGEIHEEPVTRLFINLISRGDVFFDVGCGLGHYSLLAAKLIGTGGQVHSFDIDSVTLQLLKDNIILNKFDNVFVNDMYVASNDTVLNPDYKNRKTKSITVDRYCDERAVAPNIMKIDVEGGEYQALLGAVSIIQNNNVSLICELHPQFLNKQSHKDLLKLLLRLGYKIYEVKDIRRKKIDTVLSPISTLEAMMDYRTEYILYATKIPPSRLVIERK